MQKKTCLSEKRREQAQAMQGALERCEYFMYLCEKRRVYVKRDVFMSNETYLCDQRQEYAQIMQEPSRDVKWFCEKRRIYVKRDVYV